MKRETLVPRFYGSEVEYGFTPHHGSVGFLTPPGVKHIGYFLENGGKLYPDCGLIEYATPECSSLEDLVTHEIAGEKLVWDAYGNDRSSVKTIHKRAITPDGEHSSGAHENYSTVVNSGENILSLATHFATRTVFIGAGQPTTDGYVLAQKMQHVNSESGHGGMKVKPLVDLKRGIEDAGGSQGVRIQVSSGDANMSPWAIRMKFGTTSLVLRLLEHGVDVSDLHIYNSLVSARDVAAGVAGISRPLHTVEKKMTALDVQEELAQRATLLASRIELPQEEQAVLPEWFSTIDALRRYAKTGEHQLDLLQIDWYAKKRLLDRDAEKKGSITEKRKNEIDLVYDQVPQGVGVGLRRNNAWFTPYAPSEEAVEQAKKLPPEGRAKMRGTFIKKNSEKHVFVDWGTINRKKMPIDADYSDEEIAKRLSDLGEGLTSKPQFPGGYRFR